jgi:hypothetical protein
LADYFLEFSQVIAQLSEEEFDWIGRQLEVVYLFGDEEFPADNVPAERDMDHADWSGYRFFQDYAQEVADRHDAGFCFQRLDGDGSALGRHVWVYANEQGELGPLAHLVQKFLRCFRPNESWSVTYASTCSKPRVDSFGGGAVFVTAEEIKFDSAWDFIDREAAAFANCAAKIPSGQSS